jgi:hypothetical protein
MWLKAIAHPELGKLSLHYASLAVEDNGMSVSIYTPADAATRAILERAAARPAVGRRRLG